MPDDLTPAQKRLLDAIREARAPIIAEAERRYTLNGSSLHYKTVEALERRGCLHRADNQLALRDPADKVFDANPVIIDAPTPQQGNDEWSLGKLLLEDADSTALRATDNPQAESRDSLALRRSDAGSKAREALRRPDPSVNRDESIFGWLFSWLRQRLEALVS